MNKNLVLKVMILLFGLVLVLWFRQQMGSKNVTQTINAIFGVQPKKNQLTWCADHVVDVTWTEPSLPASVKALSMADLRDHYCSFELETITGVDIDKVEWKPLAESAGATGQRTTLLWNRDLGLFKSGGLPFKSSKLASELK